MNRQGGNIVCMRYHIYSEGISLIKNINERISVEKDVGHIYLLSVDGNFFLFGWGLNLEVLR